MKKVISVLLLTAFAFTILAGCSGNSSKSSGQASETVPNTASTQDTTVTITDHSGYSVTLPADIQRIAVCDIFPLPSVLAVFFDSAEKIVAMSPTSMSAAEGGLLSELYPEILNADTTSISGTGVNAEELMKLDPQVVFYSASSTQLGETLRKAGFNAVAVSTSKWEYNAVETLSQWIDLLSQIFPESANECSGLVRAFSEDSMALINERIKDLPESERKKVFFLFQYSEDSIVTSGGSFFGQWWADSIGAVNAGAGLSEDNSVKVTLEEIYSWDPDVILMTNFTTAGPEDLLNNTVGSYDWSGVSAVQSGEVYKMPLGMYRSYTPGADTPVTLLWIAKTIYPDLFADIDITQKTMEYYEEVFGIKITDKQAESIFAPSGTAGRTDF